jgi:uncharacterized protein (TIGR02145 family)
MEQSSSSKEPELCGIVPYDPATQFCVENSVYDKCGGQEYNLAAEGCSDGIILPKCGNTLYDPAAQFCAGNSIYDKCGDKTYSPATQFCDTRDDKLYRWVKIGSQTWMAENLNYAPKTGNSWCYGDDASRCDTYGRLYDWATATEVCPAGWHLPSYDEEWGMLINFAGGSSTAGAKLKAKSPSWDGTDDYGFNALPGGSFETAVGREGAWWTASSYGGIYAVCYRMSSGSGNVEGFQTDKSFGFSVRCVKDN